MKNNESKTTQNLKQEKQDQLKALKSIKERTDNPELKKSINEKLKILQSGKTVVK